MNSSEGLPLPYKPYKLYELKAQLYEPGEKPFDAFALGI